MPPELPGFYWDPERNRYFPLSSKPKQQPVAQSAPAPRAQRHRQALYDWRSRLYFRDRVKLHHGRLCVKIASTSRSSYSNTGISGHISSFCAAACDLQYVGTDQGWLCRRDADTNAWVPEYILHSKSEVSSIHIAGIHCVATSFDGQVVIRYLNEPEKTMVLRPQNAHDIWTSHYQDASLVMAGKHAAIYLASLESSHKRVLDTQSSIFSIDRRDHLIYTGSRNGAITFFDIRVNKPRGQRVLDERAPSPVMHLKLLNDSGLLVSHMDGNLCKYDLRFPRQFVKKFDGHCHSYTRRQGFAVDLSENFLFAAGGDRRIRGWSVRTGELLQPPQHNTANPFVTEFPNIIPALQTVGEDEDLCLYATSEGMVYKYDLGQK